jgi:hypothetical protein
LFAATQIFVRAPLSLACRRSPVFRLPAALLRASPRACQKAAPSEFRCVFAKGQKRQSKFLRCSAAEVGGGLLTLATPARRLGKVASADATIDQIKGENTMSNTFEMRCPKCGCEDQIDVQAAIWVRLTSDGTDADAAADGGHDWTDDSSATCAACDYTGTVKEFEADDATRLRATLKKLLPHAEAEQERLYKLTLKYPGRDQSAYEDCRNAVSVAYEAIG